MTRPPFALSLSRDEADPVPFAARRRHREPLGSRRPLLAVLLALALGGCTLVHERARETGPQSRPGKDQGMLAYTIGRLSFEAPAGWQARGDPQHVLLMSPNGDARIDAQVVDRTFPDDAKCLTNAEQALARGGSQLSNVRRHPSSLAGRKALAQEADQGRWHGWAWAMCDGGEQYRIFFTGLSPLKDDAVRVVRLIPASAMLSPRRSARSLTTAGAVADARVLGVGSTARIVPAGGEAGQP